MFTISENQKLALQKQAKKFGLDFIVAFGSQITGLTHTGSDLDLGYQRTGKDLSNKQRFELTQNLQKIFPVVAVDVVNLRQVSPLLKHRAAFQSQLLAENQPHSFAHFQMSSYIDYIDSSYLRVLKSQYLAKKYA
jgi:predicted nucleotidyltransferase